MFATESAPGLAISGITGGYLLKLIVALGSVLLVFVVLALLTKKFQRYGQSQHRDLSVLSTLSVGTRERLMVVQVGDAQLLLGVTAARIDNLLVLETPLQSAARGSYVKADPDSSGSKQANQLSQNASDSHNVDSTGSRSFNEKLNQFLDKKGSSI